MSLCKYRKYILGIFALSVIFWSNTTYYSIFENNYNINTTLYYIKYISQMTLSNIRFNNKNISKQPYDANVTLYNKKDNDLKYILQWTFENITPFAHMGSGQSIFTARNCSKQNCFITANKQYFQDIRDFDAIAFHATEIFRKNLTILPTLRSPSQKYIFVSIETPHYYPIHQQSFMKFFNWTWTYKLNSDILFNYITIRNKQGAVIGPKEEMHWMKVEEMLPVTDSIKEKLKTKSLAAAWFVSNCETKSKRERFIFYLRNKMAEYGLEIDIYGNCEGTKCNRTEKNKCWKMIERDYYFYLSFENSFADDYVTEKLLNPLQHYTVPIVFGRANYTRFMPDGIYLNALKLGVTPLARQMYVIIKDPKRYESFFKWHQYYSYHDPEEKPETDPYCGLCAKLNDEQAINKKVYDNFSVWWNNKRVKT